MLDDTSRYDEISESTESAVQQELEKETKTITEEYIEGTALVLPNCDYKARSIYRFKGFGTLFDGIYYIKKVRHVISYESGYEAVKLDVIKVDAPVPENKSIKTRLLTAELNEPVSQKDLTLKYITIQLGDTLSNLANIYNTTVSYLAYINSIADPNLIYANQKILVPVL